MRRQAGRLSRPAFALALGSSNGDGLPEVREIRLRLITDCEESSTCRPSGLWRNELWMTRTSRELNRPIPSPSGGGSASGTVADDAFGQIEDQEAKEDVPRRGDA